MTDDEFLDALRIKTGEEYVKLTPIMKRRAFALLKRLREDEERHITTIPNFRSNGKTFSRGLYEQIKKHNSANVYPVAEDNEEMRKLTREQLQEAIDKSYENMSKTQYSSPVMYLLGNSAKMYHRGMGDDSFYRMLNEREIITTTEGAEYIENFLDDYESKNKKDQS